MLLGCVRPNWIKGKAKNRPNRSTFTGRQRTLVYTQLAVKKSLVSTSSIHMVDTGPMLPYSYDLPWVCMDVPATVDSCRIFRGPPWTCDCPAR